KVLDTNLEINFEDVMKIGEVDPVALDLNLNKLLYKKKEVIILSDFLGQIRGNAILHLARHSHVQCFRVIAKIDESASLPYAVLSNNDKDGVTFTKIHLGDRIERAALKHVVPIRIGKGHLTEFMREMNG